MCDDLWGALKQHKKEKFNADRDAFLKEAVKNDDGGWTKHTAFHWSRTINGERLDYWPSRKKFQWRGIVRRGDVMKIVRAAAAPEAALLRPVGKKRFRREEE